MPPRQELTEAELKTALGIAPSWKLLKTDALHVSNAARAARPAACPHVQLPFQIPSPTASSGCFPRQLPPQHAPPPPCIPSSLPPACLTAAQGAILKAPGAKRVHQAELMVKQIVFNAGSLLARRSNATSYLAVERRVFALLGAAIGSAARQETTPASSLDGFRGGRRLAASPAYTFDLTDPATVLGVLEAVQTEVAPEDLLAISSSILQVRPEGAAPASTPASARSSAAGGGCQQRACHQSSMLHAHGASAKLKTRLRPCHAALSTPCSPAAAPTHPHSLGGRQRNGGVEWRLGPGAVCGVHAEGHAGELPSRGCLLA